jgi:hypothetical protein
VLVCARNRRASYRPVLAAVLPVCVFIASPAQAKLQAAEANCQADADNSATLSKVREVTTVMTATSVCCLQATADR